MSRMEASEKRRIVEALILSSAEPLSAAKIAEIIPYCNEGQAKDLVNELNTEYSEQDRSFEIWEVAGGFQIRTRAEFSGYLQKLQKERAMRLSPAALETLSIIAYRQPVTRAEVEDVRGVDAGATVKSLLERHLIRIAGQREVPGRPMLYGTTRRFLEVFGLERLKDLPTLREIDELAREQGLLDKAGEGSDVGPQGSEDGEVAPISGMLDAADAAVEAAAEVAKETEGALEAGAEEVIAEAFESVAEDATDEHAGGIAEAAAEEGVVEGVVEDAEEGIVEAAAESEELLDEEVVGDQAIEDGDAPVGETIDDEADLSASDEPMGEDAELTPNALTQATTQAAANAPTNETEDASTQDADLQEQLAASDEKEEPTSVG